MTSKHELDAKDAEIRETELALAALDRKAAEGRKAFDARIAARTEETINDRIRTQEREDALVAQRKTDASSKNKNAIARMKAAGTARTAKKLAAEAGTAIDAELEPELAPVAASAPVAVPEKKRIVVSVPKIGGGVPPAPSVPVAPKAPVQPAALETAAEKERTNFDVLAESYKKQGLGELTAKLSGMPEFQGLPEGQKLLVMQGMSDRLYEHVKTEGAKKYQEDHAKSGLMGKLWKGARKTYLTAKTEKKAFKSVTGAESLAFIQKTAPELIEVFAQTGLGAYLGQDGKTVVTKYSDIEGGISVPSAYLYDSAASKLARIPDDWNKPGASKSEKAAYRKAEEDYFAAKQKYLADVVSEARATGVAGPEIAAASFASQSESMVRSMRLLSAHPNVFGKISRISKTPSWVRGLTGTIAERTSFAGAGAATNFGRLARVGSTSLFGVGSAMSLAAAPVTAAVVGGFRGYARAKDSLRERDRLARAGIAQEGKTAKRMSDVDRKIRQLNDTRQYLESETSAIKREEALVRLRTYSDFIEAKLELGQVNFGAEQGRFARQYELMRTLHSAKVALALGGVEKDLENIFKEEQHETGDAHDLRDRVRSFGTMVHVQTERARTKEIVVKTVKGIGFGALAGSAGYFARKFGEVVGWGHHAEPTSVQSHFTNSAVHQEPSSLSVDPSGKLVETPVDVDHALARVTFSSKGAEQTLLDFRHSADFKKLSPEQQEFFKGNIAKIAKELKAFRPGANDGESLNVGAGSHFGVSPDGKIFVTDTLHGGKTTVLGHFENGTFKADAAESDLHYIHAEQAHVSAQEASQQNAHETASADGAESNEAAPESPSHDESLVEATGKAPRKTPEELGLRSADDVPEVPDAPVASPVSYEEITPEQQQAMGMYNEDLQDIDPAYVSYTDHHAYTLDQELTPGKVSHIERLADRMARHQVNRFFSYFNEFGQEVNGQDSMLWDSYQNVPIRSLLAQNPDYFQPGIRPFIRHMRALADKYPEIDRSMPLVDFLKEGYRFKAEMRVLGKVMYQ